MEPSYLGGLLAGFLAKRKRSASLQCLCESKFRTCVTIPLMNWVMVLSIGFLALMLLLGFVNREDGKFAKEGFVYVALIGGLALLLYWVTGPR